MSNLIFAQVGNSTGETSLIGTELTSVESLKRNTRASKELFQVSIGYGLHEHSHILKVPIARKGFDQVNMVQLFEYLEFILEIFENYLLSSRPFVDGSVCERIRYSTPNFVHRA
jgi:hypothetical protein